MANRCTCLIINPPNPPEVCSGCLKYPSLHLPASESVTLCGQEGIIDLLEYKPSGYDSDDLLFTVSSHSKGVTDVTIVGGELTFTSVNEIGKNDQAEITVKVKRISKGDSKFFTIKINFKDECVTVNCAACNPCTGNCLTAVTKNITSTCGASSTSDMKVGSVLTGCTGGTLTYEVMSKPSSITAATISALGVISYSVSSAPIFGVVLPIKYKIKCSLFGLESIGYLNITIPDLCIGETWDDATEKCISCTGDIVDKEADLEVNKSGVGFKNSGGAGFGFN